jgi:putative membrane protein
VVAPEWRRRVIDWIAPAIILFKAAHIVALVGWIGGLLALPLMLSRHDPAISAEEYRTIRRATHITYTIVVTPLGVIAVIAGTWLIFMREVFAPWLFAKLAFVALLVIVHAWVGHIVAKVGEEPSEHTPPAPLFPIIAVILPVLAILALVLAKPAFADIAFPRWLTEPQGGQLLFDVPN